MRVGKWGQRKVAFLFTLTDVPCLTAGIRRLSVCRQRRISGCDMPQAVGRHRRRGTGSDCRRCGVFGGKCVPLTSSCVSNLVFPRQLAFERNSAFIFSDLSSSSYSVNTDSISKYTCNTYTHTHTYIHTDIRTHMRTCYMRTYTLTYINICIHMYIHTLICDWVRDLTVPINLGLN